MRGTSRSAEGATLIEASGIEPAIANPEAVAGVFDLVGDVAVVAWLMGSAVADPEVVAAIHGARLERLLEKLVDTPVRGFVYEGAGVVPVEQLETGAKVVRAAAARWRIPAQVVEHDPGDPEGWTAAMAGSVLGFAA